MFVYVPIITYCGERRELFLVLFEFLHERLEEITGVVDCLLKCQMHLMHGNRQDIICVEANLALSPV